MRKVGIFIIVFFCGFKGVFNDGKKNGKPVLISFLKNQPADSIRDFMKIYLQTKQVDVVTWKEAMELYQIELRTEMVSWINSGKINNMNEAKQEELKRSLKPVCTILALDIYNKKDTNLFIVDSIQWFVSSMPVKDTNYVKFKFYPQTDDRYNAYTVLKSFSDQVLTSGLLK